MNSHKRILWSANDPGGANAILPVVKACTERGDDILGLATGPALAIAETDRVSAVGAEHFSEGDLRDEVVAFRPDIFLVGTSAGDSIDKKIFRLIPNVPSVCVLDFWNEYWQRFSDMKKDYRYLPSVVCVMDEIAKAEMVADGVPPERVAVTGNPYFEHFADAVTRDREDTHRILFISQPLLEDVGGRYGFDEYNVLEYLTKALETMPQTYRLVIQLHPRDSADKYNKYLGNRILLSAEKTLEEALSRAGLVIGMFSPVLMQAAVAGKRVLSMQPGLIGEDPLVTNRLGLTRKIATEEELQHVLLEYSRGELSASLLEVSKLWPKGAAERIVQIIDKIHKS